MNGLSFTLLAYMHDHLLPVSQLISSSEILFDEIHEMRCGSAAEIMTATNNRSEVYVKDIENCAYWVKEVMEGVLTGKLSRLCGQHLLIFLDLKLKKFKESIDKTPDSPVVVPKDTVLFKELDSPSLNLFAGVTESTGTRIMRASNTNIEAGACRGLSLSPPPCSKRVRIQMVFRGDACETSIPVFLPPEDEILPREDPQEFGEVFGLALHYQAMRSDLSFNIPVRI
ncbi:hypothetical protein L873DRAFT_1788666 [Choiromyces venosus 120613-1]|uniref:Uncharacterized protein n=1 Tax=Choiromyces venosus 120613-1 TaxID=1336337 RepID=A0A3N4JRV5_9PEZI|nr:hypothetical protein L873DRAFT_1788666 [Choiromyces venosus 120613-1]